MAKAKTLKATVGAGVAAVLLTYVPSFEGMVLRGYKDPIGIVTACAGHTKTAVLGRPYTQAECLVLLEKDLVEHAEPVLACTPALKDKPGPLAGAVSLAFNIGAPKYCGSSAARRFNAGDIAGGCAAIEMWNKAGGKVLPGLVKRRATERAICEGRVL
ncbi:Lysozyme RrrD [compost metagenome]